VTDGVTNQQVVCSIPVKTSLATLLTKPAFDKSSPLGQLIRLEAVKRAFAEAKVGILTVCVRHTAWTSSVVQGRGFVFMLEGAGDDRKDALIFGAFTRALPPSGQDRKVIRSKDVDALRMADDRLRTR